VSETDRLTCSTLIEAAVDRGVIDADQRARLHALAQELAHELERDTAPAEPNAPEIRRGFNAVTIAYSVGAILVLIALGWFLADRWNALGPAGVLGVSVAYAAAFAAAAGALRRRRFDVAGGIAAVLAVSMTPVWAWALLRLTGEWPDPLAWDNALARYEPFIASRLIVLDLATIGVALAALRRVDFFALGAPIAVAFTALMLHLARALGDPRIAWYMGPYVLWVIACTLFAIAYAVDRRQPADEDYALWFYIAGMLALAAGYVQGWNALGAWRHATPLVAISLIVASLYLRRRTLLIGGGVAAFAYLGYLAFDVFRRVIALPLALATLGLVVIVATVWMQRRFPALVERVNREEPAGGKALPTGPIAVLGPLAIAITAMVFAVGEAKEQAEGQEWRASLYRQHVRNEVLANKRARPAAGAGTAAGVGVADSSAVPPAAPPRR